MGLRVCKTEKGYLTHVYFLLNPIEDKIFSSDITKAYTFSDEDGIDVDYLCDTTSVNSVEFINVNP